MTSPSKTKTPCFYPRERSRTPLKSETYDKARAAAPGWDIYVLESEWREWATECPRNPDAAFIGFCRKVYEKRGKP